MTARKADPEIRPGHGPRVPVSVRDRDGGSRAQQSIRARARNLVAAASGRPASEKPRPATILPFALSTMKNDRHEFQLEVDIANRDVPERLIDDCEIFPKQQRLQPKIQVLHFELGSGRKFSTLLPPPSRYQKKPRMHSDSTRTII